MNQYCLYYFKKSFEELINNGGINNKNSDVKIDVYSPFFDIISQEGFFEKMFSIVIRMDLIDKNKDLKNLYISAFNKLFESNSKYSSLTIHFNGVNDINNMKEFKIKYYQIKRLFYKRIIDKNLKKGKKTLNGKILFESNKLNSLEELNLDGITLNNIYILKFNNLKVLRLKECKNISLVNSSYLKIKQLHLINCTLAQQNSLLKFPELEDCILSNYDNYSIIDFSSLAKLKYLKAEINDFINLGNVYLESLALNSNSDISIEKEKKMLEKICLIKSLKKINIELCKINNNELVDFHSENYTVTEAEFRLKNIDDDNNIILYNLQKIFPNLYSLIVNVLPNKNKSQNKPSQLKIKNNSKSNIRKLSLYLNAKMDIEFYCQSLENLVEIDFNYKDFDNNLMNDFPLFKKKCDVKFLSLTNFKFVYHCSIENEKILNNLYDNINNMPNLKDFRLTVNKIYVKKNIYEKFITKILNLKLDFIALKLISDFEESEEYTEKEIKIICPNINYLNFGKIHIDKYKEKEKGKDKLYCKCNNYPIGEMIECGNPNCKYGAWFHTSCLGSIDINTISHFFCCAECEKMEKNKSN